MDTKTDKEKLLVFAEQLRNIVPPLLENAKAINLSGEAIKLILQASDLIIEKAKAI